MSPGGLDPWPEKTAPMVNNELVALRDQWCLDLWPMRVVREAKKISVGGNHH
jgi:hypothetical protein